MAKVLVLGGTRFFGVHMVKALLAAGNDVTVATRGSHPDELGGAVQRLVLDRTSPGDMRKKLGGKSFDVVCDNIAYCSNDVRNALDCVDTGRYVLTSSGSVYSMERAGLTEGDFDPYTWPLVWADRNPDDYAGGKQGAEAAAFQCYASSIPVVAVRFPYVIGPDDYTDRLYFYVKHVVQGIPMFIDNPDADTGFIYAPEAGRILAALAADGHTGPVNAENGGSHLIREIVAIAEERSGKKAVLSADGDPAPYNGGGDFVMKTDLAESWGYSFAPLESEWGQLIDHYVARAERDQD